MSKKKHKKHSLSAYLRYMHMIEDGYSFHYVSDPNCRIFAANMARYLYVISGCNGAGKTTASYTVLPEILDCTNLLKLQLRIADDEQCFLHLEESTHNVDISLYGNL